MHDRPSETSYLVKPFPVYFLLGLILVNVLAIFRFDLFHVGAFFAFFYVIIVPGFLLLPFLIQKQLTLMLGIVFSVALSILMLMVVGLGVNFFLPLFGINQPLTMIPLILAFDGLIYLLLILNYEFKKNSPFELHDFNFANWTIVGMSCLLPVLACLGAVSLNNGGSDAFGMATYGLAFLLVVIVILARKKVNFSIPPIALYMMALAFLLMNSMRGWFITGHDILLEYHVFTLVNNAHRWSMALYRDPYMACLSLTILPTYLQNLLHVSNTYIFKFFLQFIGALPVVVVYYLSKEYISEMFAFLAGFLYISFPTFMTDMAFLNRQGIAFVFFGAMVFALLTTEYFSARARTFVLFLFGTGMVLSHYSTSYVAMGLLIIGYVVNLLLRAIMTSTEKFGNKEIYAKPLLLTLPFVLGLFGIIFLWSAIITRTASNISDTIQQVAVNVERPFSLDGNAFTAEYSLLQSQGMTPQERLDQFVEQGIQQVASTTDQSNFYPLSLTESYSTTAVPEPLVPITSFGEKLQSELHFSLTNFFNDIKQFYAKIMQVLLLLGLLGLLLGYSFKNGLLRTVPREYVALSISGVAILVGQTVLPAGAVDYGLLRLFQQNLIFLALPIMLVLVWIGAIFTRSQGWQLVVCGTAILFFFAIFSGLFPQLTGGARPPLPLDNYGFYYDAYYTHAQEISSINWIARNADPGTPIQSDHYFSPTKMIAYSGIAPLPGLLPETMEKNAYVYLNFKNAVTGNVIEYVGGDIVYYEFPISFLQGNKNLIYNDGGSKIYR